MVEVVVLLPHIVGKVLHRLLSGKRVREEARVQLFVDDSDGTNTILAVVTVTWRTRRSWRVPRKAAACQ